MSGSPMARRLVLVLFLLGAFLPPIAAASGSPELAALQVGLRRQGLYRGNVDGELGQKTLTAIRRLQLRAGILPDGVPGKATRAALGRFGKTYPKRRILMPGMFGWDVAKLQFQLAWHGFPSGTIDGRYGRHVEGAVRRFQRFARLEVDGRAGPGVFASLRTPPLICPIALSPPLAVPPGDGFGPRGARFHTGIDFSAAKGTPVSAAGAGDVTYAGPLAGGWGNVVTIAHGAGVRTMYAHLSRVRVRVGQRVEAGATVGLVGSTGVASGPHVHFEVRVQGASVDPVTAFQ